MEMIFFINLSNDMLLSDSVINLFILVDEKIFGERDD